MIHRSVLHRSGSTHTLQTLLPTHVSVRVCVQCVCVCLCVDGDPILTQANASPTIPTHSNTVAHLCQGQSIERTPSPAFSNNSLVENGGGVAHLSGPGTLITVTVGSWFYFLACLILPRVGGFNIRLSWRKQG